ncbi:hypothetical protein V502_09023 [Pseudogymnoascus sp. VKM F-4520 (FW-2644)]|nr:hypothetical protein V502_09023 [Pseudogymnoascus sp. VKM F-4520 (FW-2644)]
MKKRAGENDVRAMVAALSDDQPAASSGTVQVTIVNNDHFKTPFTGSLNKGTQLVASIKFQAKRTLYIGAIELVDETDQTGADPQQLFTNSADCVVNTVIPSCQRYFNTDYIEITLNPINELISGDGYSFNLRYSETPGMALDALTNVTATRDNSGDTTFMASADSPATPAAEPTVSSTTTRLSVEPTTNAGPSKPLSVSPDSFTATTTGTLTTAVPSDSPGVESASAPSKGLSTGAKAGIGVGVAAAVLILIAVLVALWVRRARRASSRSGRGGAGEKESVLAAAAPGGSGEYRDADEAGAGAGVVGGSPVTRKPVGVPATNEAALADAVSPASTTVGVVGAQSRGAGGQGTGAAQESMLNAEERERWEEEERRLDEDIAEAERRRLGA